MGKKTKKTSNIYTNNLIAETIATETEVETEPLPTTPTNCKIPEYTSPPPAPARTTYQQVIDRMTPEERFRRNERLEAAKNTFINTKLKLSL